MRLMGPMVGRLQTEFLGPLIDRVFNIMTRRRMLPVAPPAAQGRNLRIDYVSPVARAQKTQQLFSFTRLLETLVPLANVKPEIFDNINADGTVRWAHRLLDAPQETLLSLEEVEQIRQGRAQQQQQAQAVATGRELAATAKDAANAAATAPTLGEQPPNQGVEQQPMGPMQ
jgi:hypothetical protein